MTGNGIATGDERAPGALCGWLVCPECESPLDRTGGFVRCSRCAAVWPEHDGIPDFIGDFPYWGEIPREQMIQVNRDAAAGSWRSALLDSPEPSVRSAAEMILNLERANWHLLLALGSDARVLDVGAGTGTNSHALALRYREVVALEPVRERIEFMRHRFAQEGLDNVRIVRSSLWSLPFPKESFGLAAMNGVLEWVPSGRDGDPRDCQKRALENMWRLLQPGGYLYVGIENRLAAGYFAGYRDPHCSLPWVTVLPRPLAHWYARRHGRPDGYRNYLYSAHGYRRLLKECGFADVQIYAVAPTYNHPRYFMPLDDNVYSYYYRSSGVRGGRARRLLLGALLGLGMLKYMDNSYVILARK